MKYKIFIILFFVFYKSYSCSCEQLSLIDKAKTHDYIAKIKITESKTIENYIDTFNPYFVKIETVKQYFGEKINEIQLFPNPVKDRLNISVTKIEMIDSFIIYNTIGQVIENKIVNVSDDLLISTAFYSNGVYFIKIIKSYVITRK